jgi:hypothetical protein
VDKMVKFIACIDNLLPGFSVICAVGDTDNSAIKSKAEKSMAPTNHGRSGGECLKIHVGESWAIHITGFCRNCDNPETNGCDENHVRVLKSPNPDLRARLAAAGRSTQPMTDPMSGISSFKYFSEPTQVRNTRSLTCATP